MSPWGLSILLCTSLNVTYSLYPFCKLFCCVLWNSWHVISKISHFFIFFASPFCSNRNSSASPGQWFFPAFSCDFFLFSSCISRTTGSGVDGWVSLWLLYYFCSLFPKLLHFQFLWSTSCQNMPPSFPPPCCYPLSSWSFPFICWRFIVYIIDFLSTIVLAPFLRSASIRTGYLTTWPLNSLTSLHPVICSSTPAITPHVHTLVIVNWMSSGLDSSVHRTVDFQSEDPGFKSWFGSHLWVLPLT